MDTQQVERVLEKANQVFGFIPNLFLEMSHNPAVAELMLRALQSLSKGVLTPAEQQVVMLAVSSWNECHYCTAAHRSVGKMMGVAQADLDRLDQKQLPADERLQAITTATWTVMEKKGWLDAGDLEHLGERGVGRAELYEIIAFVGVMTITTYINHIHGTELDDRWVRQATRPQPVTQVRISATNGQSTPHRGIRVISNQSEEQTRRRVSFGNR